MVRLYHPLPHPAPERIRVDGPRLHYLRHVLRLTVGAALEVFDGRGHAHPAKVTRLDADAAELTLGPARAEPTSRWIGVVQGLPKADKLEWILQKATELGASAVFPVETARAVVRLSTERGARRVGRWRRIAEEAARQCGRADLVQVGEPLPLLDAVARLPEGTRVLVLDEEEQAVRLSEAAALAGPQSALALVIGPEGGLTREEVGALIAGGAIAVTLGRRVMRTETASLAALAVLRHLDGELG